jgi:MtN3 and saliva related transmembrane protein
LSETLALVTTCWGLLMGLAPLLQVRVIVRERDSSGTSLSWVLILLVGFVLWFTYGVVNDDLPIVISNVVAVFVTTTLLVTTLVYARRETEDDEVARSSPRHTSNV